MKHLNYLLVAVLFFPTIGCSGPSYKADKTPSSDAGKTLPAESGVIVDVQSTSIEYDAETAQAIGAGVGGVIANQATQSAEGAVRAAATAAGAAGGAVAGDMFAENVLSPDGEELIIELDTGGIISVTQEPGANRLVTGDAVWIVRGAERTRVIKKTK